MKKLLTTILIIISITSTICSAQYILFRDTLPECKVIDLCEQYPELTADVARILNGGIILNYRPNVELPSIPLQLQFHAGLQNGYLLGGLGVRKVFDRKNGELFKQRATHGFFVESGIFYSKDFFLQTAGGYRIVFHKSYIGRYIILEPALSFIIGKKSYVRLNMNIGVGL